MVFYYFICCIRMMLICCINILKLKLTTCGCILVHVRSCYASSIFCTYVGRELIFHKMMQCKRVLKTFVNGAKIFGLFKM